MAALTPRPISWPISGGLDGKRSPLVVQPGSHLELSDVVQERLSEWRNRPGFTQVAADSLATALSANGPSVVANMGAAGMVATDYSRVLPAVYAPTISSGNEWVDTSVGYTADFPSHIERLPTLQADSTTIGFAAAGDFHIIASLGTQNSVSVYDSAGKASVYSLKGSLNSMLRVRCAATAGHLCAFAADGAGNLVAYVFNAATGAVVTVGTTIKTGLHLTQPYLDAHWYGGSTITIVARTTTDAIRFIEYNPSTGALSTDTTIAGVSCANCLSLIGEPSGSGTRLIGTSHTTPTTRVTRVSSVGAVATNDQVEAVASTQIAGLAHAAGADWSVIYRTTAPALRVNNKISGAVGTPGHFRQNSTAVSDMTIDSMGWGDDSLSYYQVIVGMHSTTATDPQDSWAIFSILHGSSGADYRHTVIVPQQASAPLSLNSSLFQAMRVSARKFRFALPVLAHYENESGTVTRDYTINVFTETVLADDDVATVNIGKPVTWQGVPYLPINGLSFYDEYAQVALGIAAPPKIPTLSQSAGGSLTLLATYRYILVIEDIDSSGNLWRSPPSVDASITLTGANATANVAISLWHADSVAPRYMKAAIYRTSGNGSLYRRIKSFLVVSGQSTNFNDTAADSAIVDGELLYTPAELATAITPPAAHVAIFNDRMWALHRDFRTELWPTKRLRPGRQPEFIEEGVVDIDDAFGDPTGIVSLDDKGVVFKRNAIYFVEGDGLEDDGSGRPHTYSQISQDIGAIAGSPIVVAGDVAYFVSERGIYSVDRSGNIEFAGAGIDKYISQPLIQTPETIFDGCFVPAKNEVRFVTTNYILVWSITFQTWTRWTGLAGMKRCLVINGRMVLFKSDGTVWREGDHTQTTDQGAAIQGVIRSAWVRAAGDFGQFRLYRGLGTAMRTAGGGSVSPTMAVYADDSDVAAQSWSPQAPIAGATTNVHLEVRPQTQNMSAFSLQITLPAGDNTWRMEKWGAEVGIRDGGAQKRPESERWA